MKVVVASDSFKGSLSSMGVATAAVRGVNAVCPDCEVVPVNIADGGEGLVEAVVEALGERVYLVEGNRENIKLTTPFDLKLAEMLIG